MTCKIMTTSNQFTCFCKIVYPIILEDMDGWSIAQKNTNEKCSQFCASSCIDLPKAELRVFYGSTISEA